MTKHVKLGIAFAVILLGAAFIITGALTGGYAAVLYKAALICLECVGIG